MVHEKIFETWQGRQVKVVVRGYYCELNIQIQPSVQVLVRETNDPYFSVPAGLGLPDHNLFDEKLWRERVLTQTAILPEQYDLAIREFEEISLSSVLLW